MKTRVLVVAFGLTIAVGLFFGVWASRKPVLASRVGVESDLIVPERGVGKQPRYAEGLDPDRLRQWEKMKRSGAFHTNVDFLKYFDNSKRDHDWDWKQPINFWGIVLDEDDRPVDNAQIQFEWTDLSPAGTSTFTVTSDKSGAFELVGRRGKHLVVRVDRTGFRRCRWAAVAFEYADPTDRAYHRPDPNRPILFRLVRMGPKEPLIRRWGMEFRVGAESGDLHLDLLGQRAVPASEPGVDLVVHAEHGPIREENRLLWYDWKVVLSVPDGGIQPGSECPPAAPEDGYLPRLEFEGRVEGQVNRANVSDWFFIKSRGAQHVARIRLRVSPAPLGGGAPRVDVHEYVLNPAGSLGLEFYDEMQVAEKYYVSPDPGDVTPQRD